MMKTKKCTKPCKKLHRMDRHIRRILWKIQAFKQEGLSCDKFVESLEEKCAVNRYNIKYLRPSYSSLYYSKPVHRGGVGHIRAKKF